jgi:hypothetical protein
MRNTRPTFKGPYVLSEKRRNQAVLFRTRFTNIWKIEIHISLKIDADDLNRRLRRFRDRRTIYRINQAH